MTDERSWAFIEAASALAKGNASLERFLIEAIKAADPDDLVRQKPEVLLAALEASHKALFAGSLSDTRILLTPPAHAGARW